MSTDNLSSLLRRLDELANITPTSVRHGLNKQQRSAPQLPAEFQPGQISVLANRSDPEHPARKFFVGAESRDPAVQDTGEPYFVALVIREPTPRVQRTRSALPHDRAMQLAQRIAHSTKFARKPFVTIYPQGEGKPSASELLSQYKNLAEDIIQEFMDTGGDGGGDDLRQQVIDMYREDGLKEKEISEIVGIPLQQVHQILSDYEQGIDEAATKEPLAELSRDIINRYIGNKSALVRTGAKREAPKFNPLTKKTAAPSWKVAAGKIAPAGSAMSTYAKVKATNEDVLSNIKKRLGDYLEDVAKAIKQGDVLGDKVHAQDSLSMVKTITTDDGKVIQIRGNADDGFRISVKDKVSETVFRSLREAETAIQLYNSRRAATSPDYKEESK